MTYRNDWEKVLLAEIRPGMELNTSIWSTLGEIEIFDGVIGSLNNKIYFADEADNLVTDGQMEAWASATSLTNWTETISGTSTINREATIIKRGTYSCNMHRGGSGTASINQNITLVAGAAYVFSIWTYGAAGKKNEITIRDSGSNRYLDASAVWQSGATVISITNDGGWKQTLIKFNAHASYTAYNIMISNVTTTGDNYETYADDCFVCPVLTATIPAATYTEITLRAEMETQMEAVGAGDYTVTRVGNLFKIASTTLMYLVLTTTTNALWPTIGFSTVADANFAADYTGTIDMFGASRGYYLDLDFQEIVDVKFNGVSLTKTTSAALVTNTLGTWWQDYWGKKLYIHTLTGDDPGEFVSPSYVNSLMVLFWLGFSNVQHAGADCLDFIPTDCTHPIFYEPWLGDNSIDSLSAVIAYHFESPLEIQVGGIALINNGWWYSYRHAYYWNNKDIRIKVGERSDAYSDFETLFYGKIRNMKVTDEAATFEIMDSRMGALFSLPRHRYTVAEFANLNTNAVDKPVPILFGEKRNITPVCINTAAYIYKISDTIFNGVTYPINSIDKVFKAGVQLTVAVDYTVDLTNGQFTLLASPGTSAITCDAKGIKDAFDLSTGLKTGLYSENVADHLYFVFNVLNEIPITQIDLASFLELQTARTQKIAHLLDEDTPTMEFNRLLQQSSIYHFIPLLNGKFAAKYYRRVVPAGTMELRNYDYDGFEMQDVSENVYYGVIVQYCKDPTTGIYKTVSAFTDLVDWHQSERQALEIPTALRDTAEAEAVLAFYSTLLAAPADKIACDLSLEAKNVIPTDKLIVSRSVETDLGTVNILTDAIYAILETHKDLAGGKVGIVAQLDSQVSIFAVHADSPHQDEHADHSDTFHGDGDHDDHTDSTHADHSDNTHSDVPHADSHVDAYIDIYADDIPHRDSYSDSHADSVHVDVSYTDHDDTHSDEPHIDDAHSNHSDTLHTDTHLDVSHIDSEV